MSKIGGVVTGIALLGFAGYGVGVGVGMTTGQVVQAKGERSENNAPRQSDRSIAASTTVSTPIKVETSILMIKPNGSRVKKGELVCELDSAALRDSLTNQQITTKSAEAIFKNSTLTREAAQHDVSAYVDDLLPREKRETQAELKLAEAELALAEEQRKAINQTGPERDLTLKQADVAIARAKLAIEKTVNRLHILESYTQDKQTRQLKHIVKEACSNELAKKATWQLEQSKEKKLERQIRDCKVLAPQDGIVVYANPPDGHILIHEGAVVRQGEMLFQVIGDAAK